MALSFGQFRVVSQMGEVCDTITIRKADVRPDEIHWFFQAALIAMMQHESRKIGSGLVLDADWTLEVESWTGEVRSVRVHSPALRDYQVFAA